MAELRNCPECDRLFAYVGRNLCPQCIEKEEEEFRVVRNYVRDHPGATVFDTAEATGVDEEKILRFLREGRLISRGLQSSAVFRCESCGKVVDPGVRYCRECVQKLDRELKKHIPEAPQPAPSRETTRERERMHIMEDAKKPR